MEPTQSKISNSFAPIEVLNAADDIDAETAALKHERRLRFRIGTAVAVVAVIALAMWMKTLDKSFAYASADESLQAIKAEGIEPVWNCIVPSTDARSLVLETDLANAVDSWGTRSQGNYARHLTGCIATLSGAESKLDALVIPGDMQPQTLELKRSVSRLHDALTDYRAFLVSGEYAAAGARVHAQKVAATRAQIDTAFASLSTALSAH
jgi:hypothetical protein